MSMGFAVLPLLAQAGAVGAAPPPPGFDSQFFLFLAVVFAALYFLILRPQRKEQMERQAAVDAIRKGDRVLTTGGLYGTVHEIDKDEGTVTLQVDKNVRLVFAKSAIQPLAKPAASTGTPATAAPPAAAGKS